MPPPARRPSPQSSALVLWSFSFSFCFCLLLWIGYYRLLLPPSSVFKQIQKRGLPALFTSTVVSGRILDYFSDDFSNNILECCYYGHDKDACSLTHSRGFLVLPRLLNCSAFRYRQAISILYNEASKYHALCRWKYVIQRTTASSMLFRIRLLANIAGRAKTLLLICLAAVKWLPPLPGELPARPRCAQRLHLLP